MDRRIVALTVACTVFSLSPVHAQPVESASSTQRDFSRLRAKVGDFLYVSDPDLKVEIGGRLATLSAGEITIDGHRFVPRPWLKIERQGDTIWDGAALGFLLGGLAGITIGAEGCLHRSNESAIRSGTVRPMAPASGRC